jgi:hypothetical protein
METYTDHLMSSRLPAGWALVMTPGHNVRYLAFSSFARETTSPGCGPWVPGFERVPPYHQGDPWPAEAP